MTRPFTLIAAVLFALATLLHLYRIFTHFQIPPAFVSPSHSLFWFISTTQTLQLHHPAIDSSPP